MKKFLNETKKSKKNFKLSNIKFREQIKFKTGFLFLKQFNILSYFFLLKWIERNLKYLKIFRNF